MKGLLGEVSFGGNVFWVKCLLGEMSFGGKRFGGNVPVPIFYMGLFCILQFIQLYKNFIFYKSRHDKGLISSAFPGTFPSV